MPVGQPRLDTCVCHHEQPRGGSEEALCRPCVETGSRCSARRHHTYLDPQFKHFAGRGHRVVAVDLRGHGQSDKPHQRYTMQVFADDLAWMCDQRNLVRPVVVGHSMGGIVAFDLAARYPALPCAVVMLDAPASCRRRTARRAGLD